MLLRLDSHSSSYIFLNSEGLQVQRAAPFTVEFLISFLKHHTNAFYKATPLLTRLIQCSLNCGSHIQMWFRLKWFSIIPTSNNMNVCFQWMDLKSAVLHLPTSRLACWLLSTPKGQTDLWTPWPTPIWSSQASAVHLGSPQTNKTIYRYQQKQFQTAVNWRQLSP